MILHCLKLPHGTNECHNNSMEEIQQYIEQVNNILYSTAGIITQIVVGVISFGLFVYYIQLIRRTGILSLKYMQIKEGIAKTPAPVGKIRGKWTEVERKINSDDETQWKFAIIEADSILDDTLLSLGYSGENMGERLKNIRPGQLPHLDDVWRVHKVRNFIAHDPSYHVKHETARRAIEIYRRIFKELGILEDISEVVPPQEKK